MGYCNVSLNFWYKFRLKSSPIPQNGCHFGTSKIFQIGSFWHQIRKDSHKLSQKKVLLMLMTSHLRMGDEVHMNAIRLQRWSVKSTLAQVLAWCRQATKNYLNQCWPRSLRHMASLGHNELTCIQLLYTASFSFFRQHMLNAGKVKWRASD